MDKTSKVSTIKQIFKINEFAGDRYSTWYFTVEMENGDKGQIAKKSKDALKVGDEVKYTIDNSKGRTVFREIKEQNFPRGAQRSPLAGFALAYAKDLAVANIAAAGKPLEMNSALAEKITATADIFYKWLKAND